MKQKTQFFFEMCDCYGSYSLLIGKGLKDLKHQKRCKQFSKLAKQKEKKKEIERLPTIRGLPKDCWIRIFHYVLWSFNYGVSYHTSFSAKTPSGKALIKILGRKSSERDALPGCADDDDDMVLDYIFSTCKSHKIYFTLEDFPPIYMLRLTCKTFKAYLDEYNKRRKMFMNFGYDYKNPKDRWDFYNSYGYNGRKNPFLGRFFLDPNIPM